MTNTNKPARLTKRDFFNAIAKCGFDFTAIDERITADAMKQFADNELELLAKKNASDRKPTKVQQENEAIKAKILAVMDTTPATVSEIMKRDEVLSALSNQKISALMTQLINDGMVKKIEEKRKSFFTLA